MGFRSLEQRMAQTYLDTFPDFIPADDGPGIGEQKVFYQLMRGLYQCALDTPELFVASLHEDDAHPNRYNKSSYGKPELRRNMQFFIKAIDDLLAVMYQMGMGQNAIKHSKRQRSILQHLGVTEGDALPSAWIWMSTREGANLLSFSRCLLRKNYPYPSEIFARLLGDKEAFYKLETWMTERGYVRYCSLDGRMSMDYANLAWNNEQPCGGSLHKVRHTGISIGYDEMVQEPFLLGLCIPNGMKKYLEAFADMEDRVKDFVVANVKKCDACGYCTQTDKTGARPKAYVPVTHHSRINNLCPLFPGYSFCWTFVTGELVDNIIAMLSFMDRFIP